MASHKELLDRARRAIAAVMSDESVPPETTLESMEEISTDVEGNCDALEGLIGH